MQLEQKELEQIDSEITDLKKGEKFTTQMYLSWLAMRGAIELRQNTNAPTPYYYPVILKKYEGVQFLYTVLADKFESYQAWKRKGKKVEDIGNFGINDNSSEE